MAYLQGQGLIYHVISVKNINKEKREENKTKHLTLLSRVVSLVSRNVGSLSFSHSPLFYSYALCFFFSFFCFPFLNNLPLFSWFYLFFNSTIISISIHSLLFFLSLVISILVSLFLLFISQPYHLNSKKIAMIIFLWSKWILVLTFFFLFSIEKCKEDKREHLMHDQENSCYWWMMSTQPWVALLALRIASY